jgi:hypothetical protein
MEIPLDLSLEWIRVNPDIYTFLIDPENDTAAAYINAMPGDEIAYAKLRSGEKFENAVSAKDVVPYVGSSTVKIYLMSIAVAETYRRWGCLSEFIHAAAYGIFRQAHLVCEEISCSGYASSGIGLDA